MENLPTKFTMSIVTLVVMVIVISTVTIPIVNDVVDGQKSINENEDFAYSLIDSSESILITQTDGVMTINDVPITELVSIDISAGNNIYIVSDNLIGRFYSSAEFWVSSPDISASGNRAKIAADCSVLFEDGVVTVTMADSTEYTTTYTNVLVPAVSGDYAGVILNGIHKPVSDCFIDSDSIIYAMYLSTNETTIAKGTISDLQVLFARVSQTTVLDDPENIIVTVEPTAYGASNKLISAESAGTYIGPNIVFVPLEYSSISDQQNSTANLFKIVPLMLIIVTVITAVGLMGGRYSN